jgi:puromycin-sensitive aminopeptidase
MENWGLVTYRETALLIDSAQSSAVSKQTVALVVGHELAHQWFGNLVTMVSFLHSGYCLLLAPIIAGQHYLL